MSAVNRLRHTRSRAVRGASGTPGFRTAVVHGTVAVAVLWSALGLLAAGWALFGPGSDPALWRELHVAKVVAVAVPLAAASYLVRFLRWHLLASRVVPGLNLADSFLAEAAGFGLTVTPARLGEMFKFYLLEQQTGVPMARSAPVIVVEKLTEGAGFLLLGLGAALALGVGEQFATNQYPALVLLLLLILSLFALRAALRRGRLPSLRPADHQRCDDALPSNGRRLSSQPLFRGRRLPISPSLLQEIATGSWRVFGPRALAEALLASISARLCDALVLYVVVSALGVALSPLAAAFILGTAGIVGGLSMLPGGLGAVETSMATLLIAFGVPPSPAIGATLLTRALIFWLWVVLGLVIVVGRSSRERGQP